MPIMSLKVIASLLQMYSPGATIQSDHPGIDAILGDIRGQISDQGVVAPTPDVTKVAFGKSFGRGGGGRFGRSFRRG
jgi:hypothetical protein